MTLTELKYVIAVARERHFGRAAESCFVSQPSLSVAIKKLEEELGVSIFERRTPDISITPVGAAIIEQAQKVLEESRLISEIAKRGQDPLAGPIRLGMIYTVAPYLMPELIVKLSTLAPKMPVYLEETYTTELISQLRTGAIDVAIMADTISDTGFMTQALYQESFVVAVPSHHPWVNRNYIGPQELRDQTMLLLGAGHCFRDQIIGICPDLVRANIGIADVQRTVEGSSLQTICHMVAQGLGITVLPASCVPYLRSNVNSIKTIPFKSPSPSRRVIMVWRNPELAPALPRVPMRERLVSLKTGLPIIIIFIVVIGGIYAGMFTATEGGGIGAFTTVFLALVMGRLSWSIVTNGLNDTGKTISMAFTVLGGAGVFSYFMTMSKIPMILAGVIASMNMPPMAVMFAIIVCMSFLGCFIPAIPLMLICVPIFLPLAALFGWNLIWFGVIINILVTMAGMTPPFGVSLFVAKELADVPLSLVYRSSIPFILAFFLCLGFCIAFEPLSTWLPAMMR